jgi:hypothetical protein
MIRAIFWDNDGVLVDTEKLYFQATRSSSSGSPLTKGGAFSNWPWKKGFRRRRSIAFKRNGTGAMRNCLRAGFASWTASRRPSVRFGGR